MFDVLVPPTTFLERVGVVKGFSRVFYDTKAATRRGAMGRETCNV